MSADFPDLERHILSFWQRERCFEKLVEMNRGKPRWSFLDGPITANNPMGVHHGWGRTYKDLYQRYKAMTGHELRYQNGFDCQGLWVEVEVEKELGFKSKRDIEAYGIGPFVEKCKERVNKYAAIQTQQSIRLGYWMDWDNSYYTMSDDNNYTIWHFLKRCHKRGFIYHGWDSMPWCPRCGTGISQHEISNEERPDVTHRSPTVKFPLRGRPGEFLLAWTTTPWTLTANVACAVHPEMTYVKVCQGAEVYYLLEERLEAVTRNKGAVEVLARMPGEALVGWSYDGPFDELPAQCPDAHRVIPWKEVSAAEGTGIVHIAPGCGKEDYELGLAHGLPAIGPIDESGLFLNGFGQFTGREAASVSELIHQSLREKSLLYRTEDYKHAYPICWRCKTQLLFRLVDEWFIRMDELRHEIIAVTEQTEWIPEAGKKLEIEWLNNMRDWMISKKRYWGLALPIYSCSGCGAVDVIGGWKELRARAVTGWTEFEGHSPHRPWIDSVKISCTRCGSVTSRIPDVGNPWLDAGIVPFSTLRYGADRYHWQKWFPADWISESFPGQFRNWFYAILAMSTVMENRPPFKLMFGYRLMKDEKGEEMHKSKGNAIEFNEAAEREGADAMRWLFASHNPEQDLWFGYNKIHDARRQFLVLWNVYEFFQTYARIDGFDAGDPAVSGDQRADLDRWILSRLEQLIRSAILNYERYSVHLFMREVNGFVGDLSRWYLRRSRRRFWKSRDDADKRAAYQTLWHCLVTAVKLLAPVIPFASEAMYQELVKAYDPEAPISVHHCAFPGGGTVEIDAELIDAMASVLAVVEQGQAVRSRAGVKVRQPVAEMRVVSPDLSLPEKIRPYVYLIREELNVKSVHFTLAADGLYSTVMKLEPAKAKPRFGKLYPTLQVALASRQVEEVESALRTGRGLDLEADGQSFRLAADEIRLERVPAEGWQLVETRDFLVLLDTRLDEQLLREGRVRDLVRAIQKLRKEKGFDVSDRIRIRYFADDSLAATIADHSDSLSEETLAVELRREAEPLPAGTELRLGEETVSLDIVHA